MTFNVLFCALLGLWMLGVVTNHMLGGFIHVLLIAAVVLGVAELVGEDGGAEEKY